jgi:hypothetical protein
MYIRGLFDINACTTTNTYVACFMPTDKDTPHPPKSNKIKK